MHLACPTQKQKKAISIQYTEKKRLIRDLSGLGQITREELREYLNRSFRGKRRGSANVIFCILKVRNKTKVSHNMHHL